MSNKKATINPKSVIDKSEYQNTDMSYPNNLLRLIGIDETLPEDIKLKDGITDNIDILLSNNLSERSSLIIHMYYSEGLNSTEISKLLNLSRTSVCNRIRKTIRDIKRNEYLKNEIRKAIGSTECVNKYDVDVSILNLPKDIVFALHRSGIMTVDMLYKKIKKLDSNNKCWYYYIRCIGPKRAEIIQQKLIQYIFGGNAAFKDIDSISTEDIFVSVLFYIDTCKDYDPLIWIFSSDIIHITNTLLLAYKEREMNGNISVEELMLVLNFYLNAVGLYDMKKYGMSHFVTISNRINNLYAHSAEIHDHICNAAHIDQGLINEFNKLLKY